MPLQPFVKVIAQMDIREKAWRISRQIPDHEEVDMSKLEYSDFALSDCKVVFLHLRTSVLFRELLMTARPLNVWSRSSRVDSIEKTQLSGEYDLLLEDELLADRIYDAVNCGKPQDVARTYLPVTMSSEYVVGANWRTWVSFMKALQENNCWVCNVYLRMLQDALGIENLNEYKYGSMLESVSFSEKDYAVPTGSKSSYGFTGMKFSTTFTHASHFARHMGNKFRTSIWDMVKRARQEHSEMTLMEPIEVITMMPTASYKAMLSHRSDWLADWNVWSGFVEAGTNDMTVHEFYEMLAPVGNYLADNLARINLTDPNILDARIAECPGLVLKRLQTEGQNYIVDRWIQMVDAGLIKENVANEHRSQYENNLRNAGRQSFITW